MRPTSALLYLWSCVNGKLWIHICTSKIERSKVIDFMTQSWSNWWIGGRYYVRRAGAFSGIGGAAWRNRSLTHMRPRSRDATVMLGWKTLNYFNTSHYAAPHDGEENLGVSGDFLENTNHYHDWFDILLCKGCSTRLNQSRQDQW